MSTENSKIIERLKKNLQILNKNHENQEKKSSKLTEKEAKDLDQKEFLNFLDQSSEIIKIFVKKLNQMHLIGFIDIYDKKARLHSIQNMKIYPSLNSFLKSEPKTIYNYQLYFKCQDTMINYDKLNTKKTKCQEKIQMIYDKTLEFLKVTLEKII